MQISGKFVEKWVTSTHCKKKKCKSVGISAALLELFSFQHLCIRIIIMDSLTSSFANPQIFLGKKKIKIDINNYFYNWVKSFLKG